MRLELLKRKKENLLEDTFKNKKIKTMIDFDRKECNSIKFIPLKRNTNTNATSRFINRKMLIFAKKFARIVYITHD